MDILYLLIPVSLLFFVVAMRLFFWAVGSGQFDDPDGAAHSILFDKDEDKPVPANNDNRDHNEENHG